MLNVCDFFLVDEEIDARLAELEAEEELFERAAEVKGEIVLSDNDEQHEQQAVAQIRQSSNQKPVLPCAHRFEHLHAAANEILQQQEAVPQEAKGKALQHDEESADR